MERMFFETFSLFYNTAYITEENDHGVCYNDKKYFGREEIRMKPILQRLSELGENYPFHMPGHMRNFMRNSILGDIMSIDITEITGYDDLHHPKDMIRESMDFIKDVYGTRDSYFLINSSTAGNLAAISAACHIGDKILIARNCHKSVYHAAELLGLHPVYVYPEVDAYGICCGITKEQIQKILKKETGIKAAVIVSPTYEGRISDILGIAHLLHQQNIPLIVDEAHGAHFIFGEAFPKSAVSLGADIVIHSLHKTLPSLTQTGLLHLCTDRVTKEQMQKKLSIFQSSSPSYILMASIDRCIHSCAENKKSFQQYAAVLHKMRGKLSQLEHLRLVPSDDIGKIVISAKGTNITGKELFGRLRDRYHLELEMSEISYVIAMTSICDTEEALYHLVDALFEEDAQLEYQREQENEIIFPHNKAVLSIEKAVRKPAKSIDLYKSEGKIAAEFVYLYPPGIPLIVPGEEISRSVIEKIEQYQKNHMEIIGYENKKIKIMNERI